MKFIILLEMYISNISSDGGKRAQIIYDYIIQDKKENPDTRVF